MLFFAYWQQGTIMANNTHVLVAVALAGALYYYMSKKEGLSFPMAARLGETNDMGRAAQYSLGLNRQSAFTIDLAATQEGGIGKGPFPWTGRRESRNGQMYMDRLWTMQDAGRHIQSQQARASFAGADNGGVPISQKPSTVYGLPHNHLTAAGLGNFHNMDGVPNPDDAPRNVSGQPRPVRQKTNSRSKGATMIGPTYLPVSEGGDQGHNTYRSHFQPTTVSQKEAAFATVIARVVQEVAQAVGGAADAARQRGASGPAVQSAAASAGSSVLQRSVARQLNDIPAANPHLVAQTVSGIVAPSAAAAAKAVEAGYDLQRITAEVSKAASLQARMASRGASFRP